MLNLTNSQLRCLLTILDLSVPGGEVASKEIAVQMRLSRPSVHRLLEGLIRHGLVSKEPYGAVELSAGGRRAAERLRELEKACSLRLGDAFGLSGSEAVRAADHLICALDEEAVRKIAGVRDEAETSRLGRKR